MLTAGWATTGRSTPAAVRRLLARHTHLKEPPHGMARALVAAKQGEPGGLVFPEFSGAARDLEDGILLTPFSRPAFRRLKTIPSRRWRLPER